ncbi:capsule-associated protein CAP1 [Agyrium rufum]|nr:capsule-associated protein CAP1 [Agyrium rufum]
MSRPIVISPHGLPAVRRLIDTFGISAKNLRLQHGFVLASTILITSTLYFLWSAYPPSLPHFIKPETESPPKLLIVHPIATLVNDAENSFDALRAKQSKSLEEAVAEYKRRYRMPPPPNFDKWYEFAVERGTELIDEFDLIHDSLLPFWALEPDVIRSRTGEILSGPRNYLMGCSIREHKVEIMGGGQNAQANGTIEMIENYVKWLPDMDLAFNVHDEPRVMVPHEDLGVLLEAARKNAQSVKAIKNPFSSPRIDLSQGGDLPEVPKVHFYDLAHQPSWSHTKLSCPPSSPVGNRISTGKDSSIAYTTDKIGFVSNTTAFSDICLTPTLSETFDSFNAYQVSMELVPVFSPSKLSTFLDILCPSTWYFMEKTHFDEESSVAWEDKEAKMYWRGSTSSGWSETGNWPHQLRQRVVAARTMSDDPVTVFHRDDEAEGESVNSEPRPWIEQYLYRADSSVQYDVQFTEIKNCSPPDCEAELDFFNVTEPVPQSDAWKAKYLLDMDGNAFSGRFFAFLRSHSLPFKLAYFREWHTNERLWPWVHFVPVSRDLHEGDELVRYFEEEAEGQVIAKRLASQGRDWASKTIRRDDMEVWMFRLLLEYGRLVDDNRHQIGYQ